MKRKKKNEIHIEKFPPKKHSINKLFKNKEFLYPFIIFLTVFFLSIILVSVNSELHLYSPGVDSHMYVQIGMHFNKILKNPFSFLKGFISNSFSKKQYLEYGFEYDNPLSGIFRSPLYGLYLGIVITLFGLSNISMLISQSFLNAILFLLVFFIVKKVKGEKTALLAVVLLLFHVSVFMLIIEVWSETFLTVFILLFTYVTLVAFRKKKRRYYLLSGILLALIGLIKPSMMFFFIIAVPGILFLILKIKIPIRTKKKYSYSFLLGLAIILLCWMFIFHRTTGRIGLMATSIGGWAINLGASPVLKGRFGNAEFTPKECRDVIQQKVRQIPRGFWVYYCKIIGKGTFDYIKNNPIEWIKNTIKKACVQLVFCPYNSKDPGYRLLYSYREKLFPLYHRLLLLLFFLYMVFSKQFLNLKIISLLNFLYHFGMYGLICVHSRFYLPLIPFNVIFSALLISNISKIPKEKWKSFINKKNYHLAGLILLNIIVILLTVPGILNYFCSSVECMKIIQSIIRNSIFIITGIILFTKIKSNYPARIQRTIILLFFTLIIFLYNLFNLTNPKWIRWKASIISSVLNQKIVLPDNLNKEEYDKGYIIIDLFYKEKLPALNIHLNNELLTNRTGPTNISPVIYHKSKKWYPGENQWLFIPIKISDLKITNSITLSCKENDHTVFGNYIDSRNILPSLIYYENADTVLGAEKIKYLETRAYTKIKLFSKENRSSIIKNNKEQKDLSDSLGLQTGRYNIYIVLKRKGNYYIDKKYSQLSRTHTKYLMLLNLVDRKVIKWHKEAPENHIPAEGNFINVILSETDRFYSGYELY